ncbi:MAG: hypothetical protein P1P69_08250 [Methanosarcinaceae archaeon]|nr:hypothetical protein [Methanosarcinaceae archaeon]MDF1534473.1 hypothetical protein [Methanosarcinaceae archaeon]
MSKSSSRTGKGKSKSTTGVVVASDNVDTNVDAKTEKGIIKIKEKTPEERKQNHINGIIKTAVSSILGIIGGIVAYDQFGTAEDVRWYAVLTIVAVLAYYAQRLIYPSFKISTKEFGFKDWFYVEFLVIDFCLVTWTLLLN